MSLGSNVGDRAGNLRAAIAALAGLSVVMRRVSSIYETEPVDYLEQPWFLNCVVEGATTVPALELLRALRELERRMGSRKAVARGPRLIDLDILLYGDDSFDTAELQVPHPRMLARRFVLQPLAEIAPEVRHPAWNGTAMELLSGLKDDGEVRKVFEPL